ncbi:PH domain-containing protein [Nocardioides daphniae]|uniref:Membrane protein n=1 Tax=Nocardioides daphniae TaxID=402297 RepID=A0ABQ1Q5E9_9ACTN|nr:PH domain-containing protein [Nocardioides daphniae]GGD14881.1 membrane protein [Nocardioides daphniae]
MTNDAPIHADHDASRTVHDALREPANRVSPRAVAYWRTNAAIGSVIVLAITFTVYFLVPSRPWWATAIVAVIVIGSLVEVAAMPTVRYRVHRWEVNDIAIHTRDGWINLESRIAPLNRVQTVDSQQGAIMRLFNLASITVTTASSAGSVDIVGLDADEARELVATLTTITAATEGDAT